VLQDLVPAVAHRPAEDDAVFKPLLKASQDLDIVVGFVDEDARHRFYIASAYLSGGRVLHVHHKLYIPTYALFDEGRFFTRGDSVRAFDTRFGRLGMLICEDFWHASPPYLLWLDGADVLLRLGLARQRLNEHDRLTRTLGRGRQSSICELVHEFCGPRATVGYEGRHELLGRIDGLRSCR
jgi:predicted amidohydrolase